MSLYGYDYYDYEIVIDKSPCGCYTTCRGTTQGFNIWEIFMDHKCVMHSKGNMMIKNGKVKIIDNVMIEKLDEPMTG